MSLNTSVPTNINDTYAVPSLPVENISNKEDKANKGIANGYAPLDGTGKVPEVNLPDTASLDAEVDGKITTHNSATTSVHGIADTADLATKAYADGAGLKAGVQWTDRHTTSTGNPYLVGSIVYNAGRVYRCIAENDSIPPQQGGNPYWADLGVGYLLPNENPRIEGGSINTSTFLASGVFYTRTVPADGVTLSFYLALSGSFNLKPTYDYNEGEYLLRYAGGSWFIELEGQAIATAVAGDEPYPWLATWPSGTSITKEPNQAGGSINASGGVGGGGGSINLSNGGGSITIQNSGGSIQLSGVLDEEDGNSSGGSIDLRALSPSNSNGGSIISRGGEGGQGYVGGTLNMSASPDGSGGSINLTAGNFSGGSINLSNGGGNITSTGRIDGGDWISGGTLNMSAGGFGAGGSINTSNGGGYINTSGDASGNAGGYIDTSATNGFAGGGYINTTGADGSGGFINTRGNNVGNSGGSINTSAGDEGSGGSINTSGGSEGGGGSINTSNGGGSINTMGGDAGSGGSINTSAGDSDGGGSINTSGGEGGVGGSINTSNGGGSINISNHGGSIVSTGGSDSTGGSINLSASASANNSSSTGGSISLLGADNDRAGNITSNAGNQDNDSRGGDLNMSGDSKRGGDINTASGAHSPADSGPVIFYGGRGGDILTSGGSASGVSDGRDGGSINTSNGGGSINTRGVGSIQLGLAGTRTTLNGSASGTDKTITLPNATGTIALTNHTHAISDVTNLQSKLNTKQEFYYSEVSYTATAGDSYSMPPNSAISDSTGPIERRILFTFSGVPASNFAYFSFPATGNAGDMVTVTNSLYKADSTLNTMQLVVREVNGTQTNTFDNILAGQSRSYIRKTSETGTGKWTFVSTTAHSHGNISNTGAIGTTANLPLITTTSGVVSTGSFGTTANTFCQGNDVRLGAKTVFTLGGDEKITYALGGNYVYGGQITRGSKVSGGFDQTGLYIQGNWTITGLVIMANYPSAGTAGVTYGLVKINSASSVTSLWTALGTSSLANGLNTITTNPNVSISDGDKIGFQLTIGSTAGATVPTNANPTTITAYVYCVPR